MNTLELLIAARKKIERPECWTKDCEARDASGNPEDAESTKACVWCGYGAVWSQIGAFHPLADEATTSLDRACGHHFPLWQDAPERTHAEVLACFSRAIESERQKTAAASNETGDAA